MEARIIAAALLVVLATAFSPARFSSSAVAQSSPVAQSPPDATTRELRVASLVRDLGSPSFVRREAADAELANIGAAAVREIEIAADSEDLEVRTRARRLLRQLKIGALWQGSLLELPTREMAGRDLVRQLCEQTGSSTWAGDQYGAFHPGAVTLPSRPLRYWEAVDELCRQTKNRVRPGFAEARSGWVLVAGEAGDYPLAYTGPFRGQLREARRFFVEEFDYRDGTSDVSHAVQLNFQISWEDPFRLVAHGSELEIVELRDATRGRQPVDSNTRPVWQVFENSRKQATLSVRLDPPPAGVTQLAELTVRWPVFAVGEMATLEADDLQDGAMYAQDDVQLVIERVRRLGSLWELTVAVSRDRVTPEPAEILYLENDFALVDAAGEAYPQRNLTKLGITASTARMKLTFALPSATEESMKLRLRYPQLRDQRAIELTFEDVALPAVLPR
ncbi:MAG: hypothetical protein DWQ31_05420 [Planctomycetota bacterium]|nr:MAG: hypothetical protein DWQ31_05420 [Planctomycetota bacterium]